MEAKDTVISKGEINQRLGYILHNAGDIAEVQKVLKAQAEISFMAGAGEVVEWLNKISIYIPPSKLKEWGVDEENAH